MIYVHTPPLVSETDMLARVENFFNPCFSACNYISWKKIIDAPADNFIKAPAKSLSSPFIYLNHDAFGVH